jgi:hypothetical protein
MTEPIFDHEKLDVYRLSIDDVAASYEIAKALRGANRHIRDQSGEPDTHTSLTLGGCGDRPICRTAMAEHGRRATVWVSSHLPLPNAVAIGRSSSSAMAEQPGVDG